MIGNRPQFIKAAAVSPPLRRVHEEILVHTGQHFDDRLSAVFFAELGRWLGAYMYGQARDQLL